MFLRFALVHGRGHSLTNYKLHGLMNVRKLSVLSMSQERQASSAPTHATDRLSCRGDSSRTRRAIIGKKLENFHADFHVKETGLCCRQLPFRNEIDHRCGELVLARQPCSNLSEQKTQKRLSVAWHENVFFFVVVRRKNSTFFSLPCLPIDFNFSCLSFELR